MNPDGKGILARLESTDEEIALAWEEAIAIAFRAHRKAGVPIASWDNDSRRVILTPPDQLPIPGAERPEPVTSNTRT